MPWALTAPGTPCTIAPLVRQSTSLNGACFMTDLVVRRLLIDLERVAGQLRELDMNLAQQALDDER